MSVTILVALLFLPLFFRPTGSLLLALCHGSDQRGFNTKRRRAAAYHLSSLEHLIAQQKIRRNARAGGDAVSQDSEGVEDALLNGVHGFARLQVQANGIAFRLFVLECRNYMNMSAANSGRWRSCLHDVRES